jgi:hypothetical protein
MRQATQLMGGYRLRRIAIAALATAAFTAVLAFAPAPASASPVIIRDDLAGIRFLNPCTGEHMTITDGTLQFVINLSGDANGGFHMQVRGAAQGVVATGDVSGDMYRLAGDFWIEENVGADDALPLVVQVVEVHNVLSQGSSDNLIVRVLSHLTINPDGRVAAFVDSISSECRG